MSNRQRLDSAPAAPNVCMVMKLCARCGQEKPLTSFSVKDGRPRSICKPCRVIETREWRQSNPEKARELAARWAAQNREKRKAIWTKSRLTRLTEVREIEAAYRERNRAQCNDRIKEWKRRNPESVRESSQSRRAAERVPAWANKKAMRAIYREAKKRGAGWHVDHIVPLRSPLVCGLHCEANLQILPAKDNQRKCNYRWPDMP